MNSSFGGWGLVEGWGDEVDADFRLEVSWHSVRMLCCVNKQKRKLIQL